MKKKEKKKGGGGEGREITDQAGSPTSHLAEKVGLPALLFFFFSSFFLLLFEGRGGIGVFFNHDS